LLWLCTVSAVGPVLVLLGGEVVPHVLNPCVPCNLWGAPPPSFCVRTAEGFDVPDRWHALDHAVVGFLPLSLLIAWSIKRLNKSLYPATPSGGAGRRCLVTSEGARIRVGPHVSADTPDRTVVRHVSGNPLPAAAAGRSSLCPQAWEPAAGIDDPRESTVAEGIRSR
jgi:hypothetical protein